MEMRAAGVEAAEFAQPVHVPARPPDVREEELQGKGPAEWVVCEQTESLTRRTYLVSLVFFE